MKPWQKTLLAYVMHQIFGVKRGDQILQVVIPLAELLDSGMPLKDALPVVASTIKAPATP